MVKRIEGIPFSLSDINLLERELIDGIETKAEELGVEDADFRRVARMVANKMNFMRGVLTAERIAERSGYEVVKDGAKKHG